MKIKFLLLLPVFVLLGSMYEEPGPIIVNYIIQNPKYYPDSKSYFLVGGMRDKKLQQTINDSLAKWFMGKNQFYLPGKNNIPKVFKNRKLNKDETLWLYNYTCDPSDSIDGIIFRDKDSLLKKDPSGYKKCGHSICTWGAQIFRNQLLCISMEYNPATNPMKIDDPMFMDLRTGKRIYPKITIVFPDSLQGKMAAFMKTKIEENFRLQYGYSKADATPTLPVLPITLATWQISGLLSENDLTIPLNFQLTGITKEGNPIILNQPFQFSLSDLAKFTDGNYLKEEEAIFK